MNINYNMIKNNVRVVDFTFNHISNRYISWLNDKEVVKFSEQRHFFHSFETAEKYFHEKQNSEDFFLAIEFLDYKWVHVGNIGVSVNKPNQLADLSILVGDKNYWGKGIALTAWNLVLDYLLNNLRFRIVTAGTMEINTPMIKLMKKSEMNIDAVLPSRFNLDGKYYSLVVASKS